MLDLSAAGRVPPFTAGFADGFRGAALVYRGDVEQGLALMRGARPVWREFWGAWCYPLDVAYAEVWASVSGGFDAQTYLRQTLADAKATGAVWWNEPLHAAISRLGG